MRFSMGWADLDYRFVFAPVLAAVIARAVAEYLLLTWEHPLVVAPAKAVKAAAIPFAVAFYIVLITAQIQM